MANWISVGSRVIVDAGDEVLGGILQAWKYESSSGGSGSTLYRSISSTPRAWIVIDERIMPESFHFGDVRKDTPSNREKLEAKLERRRRARRNK
jgi:hypothetical protein